MSALSPLGTVHTLISVVAVVAGAVSLIRSGAISPQDNIGKLYIGTTVLTCVTGFGIFAHGGVGPAHILGVLTLLVLALAGAAGATTLFGKYSSYVETVAYSTTFFFHMVPAATEGFTRLPVGAPVFAGPEAPGLETVNAVFFLLFLLGAVWQVRQMRRRA